MPSKKVSVKKAVKKTKPKTQTDLIALQMAKIADSANGVKRKSNGKY